MVQIVRSEYDNKVIDPLQFIAWVWPEIRLYDKQAEILYSLRDNKETIVPAGNGLGKDYICALGCLWFFVSRSPARVVTTSVQSSQLDDVLWGEIRNFLDTATVKLPVQYNHMNIRQIRKDGTFVPKAELVGQVINKGESLLGRHLPNDIPRTLAAFDEASGIDTSVYTSSDTWAHRKLVIGNPFPCMNFFRNAVKEGDQPNINGPGYRRKVINIRATDSPNVKRGMYLAKRGLDPFNDPDRTIIPGLVDYEKYLERLAVWDKAMQSVGLWGEFYEGEEIMLTPLEWLEHAANLADELIGIHDRTAEGVGVDTAQGGDNTVWTAVDHKGVLEQLQMKTADTSIIPKTTKAFLKKWRADPSCCCFDVGGGGKEHADRLRQEGYRVRTVAFGAAATAHNPDKGNKSRSEKTDVRETQYTYKNRRAELYGMLRILLDPKNETGFAIPRSILYKKRIDGKASLCDQLKKLPLLYDDEGRIWLPPKNKKNKDDKRETLTEMIGCSPDESDSLALANFGMQTRRKILIGVV